MIFKSQASIEKHSGISQFLFVRVLQLLMWLLVLYEQCGCSMRTLSLLSVAFIELTEVPTHLV